MDKITDEMLVAFADDELDAAKRRQLSSRLATEPELERRLAVFTMTGRSLSRLYDRDLQEPIPERLLETVDRHTPAPDTPRPGRSKSKPVRQRGLIENLIANFPMHAGYWQGALAVGLALVFGATMGWQLKTVVAPDTQTRSDTIIAHGALRDALESAPSGSSRKLDSARSKSGSVKPILTFAARDGGFCREYQLAGESGHSFTGFACRNEHGAWQVRFHVPARVQAGSGSKIVPAGAHQLDAIDAVVEQFTLGDVLSPAQETSIIKGGWQSAR